MAAHATPLPPFDTETDLGSVGPRWTKWLQRFENYTTAMNITGDARLRALLLHVSGEKVHDVYDTLATDGDKYADTKQKLSAYFAPKKHVQYQIYLFRKAVQESGETLDNYHTRLRILAKNCEFADMAAEIKTQIIQSCTSSQLRRKALREPDLTLDDLLNHGRACELSELQATGMEADKTAAVNKVQHKTGRDATTRNKWTPSWQPNNRCRNCGGRYPHEQGCPAKDKICNACGKFNHFAKQCRSKRKETHYGKKYKRNLPPQTVHQVTDSAAHVETGHTSSSDDAYVYVVNTAQHPKLPHTEVRVMGTQIPVLIDSGATANCLTEATYNKLTPRPMLTSTDIKIYPYHSSTSLPVCGAFRCSVEKQDKTVRCSFFVIKGGGFNILSFETSKDLGLLHIVTAVTSQSQRSVAAKLVEQHPELFQGIGKLKDFQVKLHINTDVKSTCQPHRRVPFHLRQKVEDELQKLEADDIIEKVTGPTPWVSPIVTLPEPKNPDEVRICVDMRQANTAIERERHVTPTIDDVIHELNGSTVFSKLDLRAGYHQLELHPDSRYITTFTTHLGLRRYKRLSFGVSSAAEVFQNAIHQTLQGLNGVKNLSDDIIVFGRDQADHDNNLTALFKRLSESGLTLNREKCEFNKTKLEFFGFIFSAGGVSADPKKVAAVQHAPSPKTPADIKSLLGMANYCSRFIRDFSSISEPLRRLTHKDTPWTWGQDQETALQALKVSLTSDTTMSYFYPSRLTELIVDASPVGLGAILCQQDEKGMKHIIAYASRALSDVETRYSQTEKEALAIVWSCEHFHLYVYGHPFTLVTDHKALEIIWNNPRSKPPARIERWGLRLQPYNFRVEYRKGADNPADFMSRHPVPTQENESARACKVAEEYVNFFSYHSTPKAMTLQEIKTETLKDQVLQEVIGHIRNNTWHLTDKSQHADILKSFKHVQSELTVADSSDFILRGTRIVIPPVLQERAIQLAHEGHQGIVKTKALLRTKVWFPEIDRKAESAVQNCLPCQASTPVTHTDPLQMSPLPETPWHSVSADFYGPLPTGEYLLVVTDEYSRYPVVESVRSTSASSVIPVIDKVFSMFGIPRTVKTDNGPPFNSEAFSQFADYLGFHHRKITPCWPQANAIAERFMRTLGKALRVAETQGTPWKQQLNIFLREYRSTPHSTTASSPAEILFQRQLYTKLPFFNTTPQKCSDAEVRARDDSAKIKMKAIADATRHARPHSLSLGDTVLHRQPKHNKLSTPYNAKPYNVTKVKGSEITATRDGHSIVRNASFFKKIRHGLEDAPPVRHVDPALTDKPTYPVRSNRRVPMHLSDYIRSKT
uniref:Gypsy retrotransposon integrase-like protein 1 n=1 Tax=Oreochromis niloticus TaxID=8128 RepID=A0A669DPM2_ORENI